MNRLLYLSTLLSLTLFAVGCGNGSGPTSATTGAPVPNNPAARTVHEFLDAIRIGDTQGSTSRLTPLALQRISESDMVFAPPASENARFTIGKVEMYSEDKAFVDSVWTDLDADGAPISEQMTWALRLDQGQWRISGMAAQLGPNQPPVLIDFENPSQLMGGTPRAPASQPQQQPQPQQGVPSPRHAQRPTQNPFQGPVF